MPAADVRAWRELITFRKRLIEKRTRAKNVLRCLLRSLGIDPPQDFGLWSRKGVLWLKSLEFDQPLHGVKCGMLVEELETHSRHIRLVEKELLAFSQDNPAVQLVMTIPGVGLRTAEAVVRSSTTRIASPTANGWDRTSVWCRLRISRVVRTGWDILQRREPRW